MSRSFLFLQGPHGRFLRQLGRGLEQEGHKVLRVNLTGGDWIDWRGRGTVAGAAGPTTLPAGSASSPAARG